jgi:hypothetical protein
VKDGPFGFEWRYLRVVLLLRVGFAFAAVTLSFLCAFSVSALASAARNAFVSTLYKVAASVRGSSSLVTVTLPAGLRSMASKMRTANAAASAFL